MGKYVPPQHRRGQGDQTHQVHRGDKDNQENEITWDSIPDFSNMRWSEMLEDEMEQESAPPQDGEWVTIKNKSNRKWKRYR